MVRAGYLWERTRETVGLTMTRSDVELAQELSDLIDLITPFAIQAANELRVPDALAAGPLPVERLADRLGCQADALRRLLRTLSRKGIFDEVEPDVFALATLGQPLRSDHPVSLREANLPWLPFVMSLYQLPHSIRTGRPSFDHVHGMSLWEYLAANPRDAELFDRQMRSISGFEAMSLAESYEWEAVRTVADIGGGDGTLLNVLLSRYGSLTGTLFELPHLVSKESIVDDDRLSVAAGDFFVDELPRGREVYVLKRILYGFDDTKVLALLGNLRRAMEPGARALIVEPFTRAGADDPYFTHRVDLLMLAVPGGRVRSVEELGALLTASAFETGRVFASATPAIEARAV